ncbi:MAG: nitronate monooxygenase [Parasphingorhabdus sp.]
MRQFKELFGLSAPIVQGPMGGISGAKLVATVSNAGALGILPIWFMNFSDAKLAIVETQRQTRKRFGVNIRSDLVQLDHISAAIDCGVSIIHCFWGDPAASLPAIADRNADLICTVTDDDTAKAALDAGAVTLIAQGVEAGGHVQGTMPVEELLARTVDLAEGVPVVAAGGFSSAEDLRQVVAMGASGGLFGTRFVLSKESLAHPAYQDLLIKSGPEATIRTTCFDIAWPDAPHRVLKNSTFRKWEKTGQKAAGDRPGEGDTVLVLDNGTFIPRYHVVAPDKTMIGNVEAAALYAGKGVEHLTEVLPAAFIIQELSHALNGSTQHAPEHERRN